jgi:hypothetical protein
LQIKTKIVSHHTADSKPVKQEVNSTVILPPLVFSDSALSPPIAGLQNGNATIFAIALDRLKFYTSVLK